MNKHAALQTAIIGYGYMGQTHATAYDLARQAGQPVEIALICDRRGEQVRERAAAGHLPISPGALAIWERTRRCTDWRAAVEDPRIQAVSICTYTDTHVEIAAAALAAGKHVLLEKPLATNAAGAAPLTQVASYAAERGQICMVALCMRFWPAWSWLRDAAASGEYGAVRSAVFTRLSHPPNWATSFYGDHGRSGGALVDLHIHDADFVRWCLGEPQAVTAAGDADHLTCLYHYAGGPRHVAAEGGWDHAAGFGFRMRYTVIFERATAEFDIQREPQLLLSMNGSTRPVEVGPLTGYDLEIRAFLQAVRSGGPSPISVEDALRTTRLLDAERASLGSGAREPVPA